MTTNERRWAICMEWFNSNPNVKKYFINSFTQIGKDNPFNKMKSYCLEGTMYRNTERLILTLPESCNRAYLLNIWSTVKIYCRTNGV